MQETPLFLLGTGRSGTTLIQRILNTYDEVVVWGEHAGFLESMADAYFTLKDSPSMHEYSFNDCPQEQQDDLSYYKNPKHWQAWINWFKSDDVDDFFRAFLQQTFNPQNDPQIRIWGFKEIRYGVDSKVIDFLQALYPKAVFLCIVRDGLNVIESQLTTFHQGTSKYPRIKRLLQLKQLLTIATQWKKMNSTFLSLSQAHANVYLIRYEDFLKNPLILNPPLQQLGLSLESKQLDIIQLKEGRGSSFKATNKQNERWRTMGIIPLFLAELIIGKSCKKLGYERPNELTTATKLSHFLSK